MPLAYYSRAATSEFWSEHWGGHTVAELLAVARRSPLPDLIERHLPGGGRRPQGGAGGGPHRGPGGPPALWAAGPPPRAPPSRWGSSSTILVGPTRSWPRRRGCWRRAGWPVRPGRPPQARPRASVR